MQHLVRLKTFLPCSPRRPHTGLYEMLLEKSRCANKDSFSVCNNKFPPILQISSHSIHSEGKFTLFPNEAQTGFLLLCLASRLLREVSVFDLNSHIITAFHKLFLDSRSSVWIEPSSLCFSPWVIFHATHPAVLFQCTRLQFSETVLLQEWQDIR